jgi:dihydroorotate dehydrogenase
MVDLRSNLAGIKSPNPFWLASAPPTNSGYQVMRAFEAGWGGVVWKTLGEPIVNVTARFAALDYKQNRIIGLNNIELITDRPLEDNLREIRECKKAFPDRAIVGSLMEVPERQKWHDLVNAVQDAGVDGFELNFGCPHGMSERGMGAAVGQHPDLVEMVTKFAVEAAKVPVIVKLTPNITDVRVRPLELPLRAVRTRFKMINTINSIMGIDLGSWNPNPERRRQMSSHGGIAVRRSSRSPSIWSTSARATPKLNHTDLGDRRYRRVLARRGRVLVARREQRADLHRGDAPWVSHRRSDICDGLNNVSRQAAASRQLSRTSWARRRIKITTWENLNLNYQGRRRDRSRDVYSLQQVLHRLRRCGAPVHRPKRRSTEPQS